MKSRRKIGAVIQCASTQNQKLRAGRVDAVNAAEAVRAGEHGNHISIGFDELAFDEVTFNREVIRQQPELQRKSAARLRLALGAVARIAAKPVRVVRDVPHRAALAGACLGCGHL